MTIALIIKAFDKSLRKQMTLNDLLKESFAQKIVLFQLGQKT